ncbi:Glutathione peroxidase 2 [Manis javanica]|nr:Glutathione peroxidase 2 [Manis javanica]
MGRRRLLVLGFPCNQFGHQENCQNEEILNSLKHVRPGGGFQPTFTLVQKCEDTVCSQETLLDLSFPWRKRRKTDAFACFPFI